MSVPGFAIEPLDRLVAVGAVTPRSARLWVRAPTRGDVRFEISPKDARSAPIVGRFTISADNVRDNTLSVLVPDDFPGAPPLTPLTRYKFRVVMEDGAPVGDGEFETAPVDAATAPSRFSIAIGSCHQPFTQEGRVAERSLQMLRAARECLRRHNVKMLLLMGDQMYADAPPPLSLFNDDYFPRVAPDGRHRLLDCSDGEVRQLYQMRHRLFFAPRPWQELLAEFPSYPILDDHEIIDNWGSHPDHQTKLWQAVGKGAFGAYEDYQASRILGSVESLPDDFGYAIEYGPVAVHVLDIRSQRRVDGKARLYSDEQFAKFERFLERNAGKEILFFVLSVPPVHLPPWAARIAARFTSDGEDFSDRWSTAGHVEDRDQLLKRLHEHQQNHPQQRLVILSGDIHIACAHELRWRDGTPSLWQFISSGITHRDSFLWRLGAELSIRLTSHFTTADQSLAADVHLVHGHGATHNPYRTLNIGLVEIETPHPGARPTMRYLIYGHRGDEPVCKFRSDPL